jgi:thioredoxin reductase
MREVELLIVGAGQAGAAAAREAVSRGIQPLVVDEQSPERLEALADLPAGVGVLSGHGVWGIFPGEPRMTVGVFDAAAGRSFLVPVRDLILATGSVDVDLAFEGADLPGVVGGLEALRQLRTTGGVEARRMVILGSGDVARDIGHRAHALGVEVAAIVGPGANETAVESAAAVYPGHGVARALGASRVEQVVLASAVIGGDDVAVEADTVCVAIGRQPAIELAYLAGCPIDYEARLGGHVPRSIPGVTVAGDLAGTSDAADPFWHRVADREATDETVICACEGVTRGQILEALPRSYGHPDEVKRLTRAGMGVCQGRHCRVSIASLIARRLGVPLGEVPIASFRPPVRLLPLAALATEAPPPLLTVYAPFAAAEARLADAVREGRLRPLTLVRFRRAALEVAYRCQRDAASAVDLEHAARALESETMESERRQ